MGARALGLRRALLDQVADAPLTVETRALLLLPTSELFGAEDTPERAVLRNRGERLVAAVGRAGRDELRRATAGLEGRWDLIAPIEELDRLARLLTDWRPEPAIVFALPPETSVAGVESRVQLRRLEQDEPGLRDHLTGELADEIEQALGRRPLVAAFVDGVAVSFCYAHLETEAWWDVAIETLADFQRRGLAAACAARLVADQRKRGKRPVWGALASNEASRGLARHLGFRPVGRLAVLEKGLPLASKCNSQVT